MNIERDNIDSHGGMEKTVDVKEPSTEGIKSI